MPEKKEHAPKVEKSGLQKELLSFRQDLSVAPVLAFLEKFDAFLKKKKRILTKDELLFEPGENPYLYIVASGALSVFRLNPTGETKEVGRAYTGQFLGEGIISGRNKKDTSARSITEATVVVELTSADLEYLESVDPGLLAKLYKHINNITSLRLSETGRELAILYELTAKFQEFREKWQHGLLDAIEHLKMILSLDAILLIESHPSLPNLHIYKYNTKFPTVWPINQKVEEGVKLQDGMCSGPISGTLDANDKTIVSLVAGEKRVGFLVVSSRKDTKLSDADNRILAHTCPLIASMLEHIQHVADEKARIRQKQ